MRAMVPARPRGENLGMNSACAARMFARRRRSVKDQPFQTRQEQLLEARRRLCEIVLPI